MKTYGFIYHVQLKTVGFHSNALSPNRTIFYHPSFHILYLNFLFIYSDNIDRIQKKKDARTMKDFTHGTL